MMIVDLLRNDLSRIAVAHSDARAAAVPCRAAFPRWQMTSTLRPCTRPGIGLADVRGAVSLRLHHRRAQAPGHAADPRTGAGPRGIYCGAVGVVRRQRAGAVHATFNVPIRTVVVRGDRTALRHRRGITADAGPRPRVAGMGRETRFAGGLDDGLSGSWKPWRWSRAWRATLIGTWRAWRQAAHFGYLVGRARVLHCRSGRDTPTACGDALAAGWRRQPAGQALPLQPTAQPVRLQLADRPLQEAHDGAPQDDAARSLCGVCARAGLFDTVLHNAAGEVTESTFGQHRRAAGRPLV